MGCEGDVWDVKVMNECMSIASVNPGCNRVHTPTYTHTQACMGMKLNVKQYPSLVQAAPPASFSASVGTAPTQPFCLPSPVP